MTHNVTLEWGPMMSSCFIVLKEGPNRGTVLHISGNEVSVTKLFPGLGSVAQNVEIPFEDVRGFLPKRDKIEWSAELQGSSFPSGYELRGKGDGFRAWIKDGSSKELTANERSELLSKLNAAKTEFFPGS